MKHEKINASQPWSDRGPCKCIAPRVMEQVAWWMEVKHETIFSSPGKSSTSPAHMVGGLPQLSMGHLLSPLVRHHFHLFLARSFSFDVDNDCIYLGWETSKLVCLLQFV